jgi:hypothetical protein
MLRELVMEKKSKDTTKRAWVHPKVTQMRAGSAESQRGNAPDGGGGFQGS